MYLQGRCTVGLWGGTWPGQLVCKTAAEVCLGSKQAAFHMAPMRRLCPESGNCSCQILGGAHRSKNQSGQTGSRSCAPSSCKSSRSCRVGPSAMLALDSTRQKFTACFLAAALSQNFPIMRLVSGCRLAPLMKPPMTPSLSTKDNQRAPSSRPWKVSWQRRTAAASWKPIW